MPRSWPGACAFSERRELCRVAGVDRQHRAGDVAAGLAEQELDTARDVRCFCHPPERAATRDLLALLGGELVRHVGVDEARRNRVDRDAEAADLACERSR